MPSGTSSPVAKSTSRALMLRSKISRTCRSDRSAPGSARPAATSTFFSMYSRALAACRGCRLTAVTDTSAAQTMQSTAAKTIV